MADRSVEVIGAIKQLETDLTYHSRLTRHAVPDVDGGEHARQLQGLETNLRFCETDISYAECVLECKVDEVAKVRVGCLDSGLLNHEDAQLAERALSLTLSMTDYTCSTGPASHRLRVHCAATSVAKSLQTRCMIHLI